MSYTFAGCLIAGSNQMIAGCLIAGSSQQSTANGNLFILIQGIDMRILTVFKHINYAYRILSVLRFMEMQLRARASSSQVLRNKEKESRASHRDRGIEIEG